MLLHKRIVIWAAKPVFASARKLAAKLDDELGLPVIIVGSNNTKYQPRYTDYIINWGNSKLPLWVSSTTINECFGVSAAVDKLMTLNLLYLYGVPAVEFTPCTIEAQEWIDAGAIVFGRSVLNGHSGVGIIHFESETITSDKVCPLYTKYKKKKLEFRVHVFNNEVIDVTWKRKRKGVEANSKIRNFKNGWVYCRDNLVVTDELKAIALNACEALSLDFGAVDVIFNELENKYYVLEVNTAPGLAGTTLDAYTNSFVKEINK